MADQPIDLAAARRLADDLAQKLAELQSGGAKLDALRAEVEALRRALAEPEMAHKAQSPGISQRLRAIESASEYAAVEVKADGIKLGVYLAEIGRILGLD